MRQFHLLTTVIVLFVSFIFLSTKVNAQHLNNPKYKVLTVDFSKGNNPGKEYVEFIVAGTKTCNEALGGDSIAHLGNCVLYDKNGDSVYYINKDTFPGIASGHYRFPDTPTWDSIPYGSLIVVYNDREKSNRLNFPDDSTGKNRTYIIPARWLQLYDTDTLTIALPDSIVPTPQYPAFTLGEDSNAYMINPIYPPYVQLASNWGKEQSGAMYRAFLRLIAACIVIFITTAQVSPNPTPGRSGISLQLICNLICGTRRLNLILHGFKTESSSTKSY